MLRIFKNLLPYKAIIAGIVALLMVQAYCDLSLPEYTANIIDIGIQKKGVEYVLPDQISNEEYQLAQLYMTTEEKEVWSSAYEEMEEGYKRVISEEEIEEANSNLMVPIVLSYQMGNLPENEFYTFIEEILLQSEQTAPLAEQVEEMELAELEDMFKTTFPISKVEDEDGNVTELYDVRSLIQGSVDSGQMTEEMLQDSREELNSMLESLGDSTLSSMGVAYAISCNEEMGIDMDQMQMDYLWKYGSIMLLYAFGGFAAAIVVGLLAAKVAAKIGMSTRGKIYEKVVNFSNTEMDKFSTASLITRSTNDIQQIQMVTAFMLRIIFYAPILGLGGVYRIIQTGADMEWIILVALVVILLFVATLMMLALPKFKVMQKLVDKLNLISREILTGLSVIRAFGREKREEERFETANQELTKNQLFANRIMACMMPGMMFIMYALIIGITWVSSQRIDTGDLQIGEMTAFITYSMQIVMSFLMITIMSVMLPRAGVAADRIHEVIETEITIKNPENPVESKLKKGVVEFKNVKFRYPSAEEDALHHISFTAIPGQTTAIIGSTGSGKTTLINLIPRFYDLTDGEILIDDIDVRDIELHRLRDSIGFVPQKGVLFSGTIESNLKFGNENATIDEVKEAATIAQASDFIDEKKNKYESSISQGGSNVSGGQKQRLAIARAIAKKPLVYIFDDSFSALDMKTDRLLREALEEKVKYRTVIIVAQRISTIINAEQILVLDDGEIVGRGTHNELMENCEVYQQIASSQLSEEELERKNKKEDHSNE